MIVGYARTSTIEQEAGFKHQIKKLKENKCEKIFKEQVSAYANRNELKKCLEFVRTGDTLIVTQLSRFARSNNDLYKNLDILQNKKVTFKILDMNLDTSTPTGKLLLSLMGSINDFEREIMLERQKEGIAKAKKEGKYSKSRNTKVKIQIKEIKRLNQLGIGPTDIARTLGIGLTSVYRYR